MPVPQHGGGGVTPFYVYRLLIGAGYSTTQAIGIMANAMNESNFDPEAVGAGSYGLWQWQNTSYPKAPTLVTGNAQVDARNQVRYLTQTASRASVTGSTPAQVAGNFASKFERCAGCQPGGAQYNSRVANASTIAGWVKSGKWPTRTTGKSGFPGGTGTGTTSTPAGSGPQTGATCLLAVPNPFTGAASKIPILNYFVHGTDICLFTKTNARALVGGLMIAGGGIALLTGTIIVVASAFSRSPAAKATGRAAEVAGAGIALIPGAEGAGAAVAAAGHGTVKFSEHVQKRRAEKKQVQESKRERAEAG